MVEAAEQRPGEVGARSSEPGDLRVEHLEPPAGDGLPLVDVGGVENALDVVERQARVLQHADEDEPPEGRVAIAALSRRARIGGKQAASFVVADRRSGDARPSGDFADRQERFGHIPT